MKHIDRMKVLTKFETVDQSVVNVRRLFVYLLSLSRRRWRLKHRPLRWNSPECRKRSRWPNRYLKRRHF